ncbi:carboxypeptidase-like regulatory domain-containing protein, partial [Vibrio parahaemolyticus]|nr:carboxypeptidase-like regulatory domain-containing protein [Vibrio parahaemolyticus]
TDPEGRYRIAPLPPRRDYRVSADKAGFARVEIAPVELDPGRTTTLDLQLRPASGATARVEVEGKGDAVDLGSNRTSTVLTAGFLEALPILGR